MRVRKTIALSGTLLFLIGCVLLYLMMDQTITPKPQILKYEDENKVCTKSRIYKSFKIDV